MPYTSTGKQILRDGAHFADMVSVTEAERVTRLLNPPAPELQAVFYAITAVKCRPGRDTLALSTLSDAIESCPVSIIATLNDREPPI